MNPGRIKQLLQSNIELAISLGLLCALTSINAWIFHYRFSEIFWLYFSSLCAGILVSVSGGQTIKRNYLLNGEGIVAILAILAGHVLYPAGSAIIAAVFCLCALIVFRTFLLLTDIETIASLPTNISALAACMYLIHRFSISISTIQIIVTGTFRTIATYEWIALVALILMIPLYPVISALRHEIMLFSMGKNVFEEIGYRYHLVLVVLSGLSCALTAASVLGSGAFAAAGMAFVSSRRNDNKTDNLNALMRIAIAVQTLALLQGLAGGTVAFAVAVFAAFLWPKIARRIWG